MDTFFRSSILNRAEIAKCKNGLHTESILLQYGAAAATIIYTTLLYVHSTILLSLCVCSSDHHTTPHYCTYCTHSRETDRERYTTATAAAATRPSYYTTLYRSTRMHIYSMQPPERAPRPQRFEFKYHKIALG